MTYAGILLDTSQAGASATPAVFCARTAHYQLTVSQPSKDYGPEEAEHHSHAYWVPTIAGCGGWKEKEEKEKEEKEKTKKSVRENEERTWRDPLAGANLRSLIR